MTCKKTDCPIFEFCEKEKEQSYYCRKVELLVHLARTSKIKAKETLYQLAVPDFVH